ncbi:MAG TPA: glycosyltransferase [Xanthobacteraceae bacterium]|nr:glycosyltransferase [Xanthobacteraceae bacterium]
MTRVSVVINTYNRAESLRDTIKSFLWLDYREFEVVVVNGPSTDDTNAIMAEFGSAIKAAQCPTRNLSRSRNIGIRLAAGDVIAFIDDDAIPDPAWLDSIVPLFSDAEVGGAGGPVFDHTGSRLQAHYLVCDRFGAADRRFDYDPSPLLNMPYGAKYCSTLGTNSLFRRAALVDIGGFDEEYEYFLDETDVCVRMVDAGWTIRYAPAGYVYHRYLPSHIRSEARIISNYDPVLKNKAYFAMRHGSQLHGQSAVQAALDGFTSEIRNSLIWAVNSGYLYHDVLDRFEQNYNERIRHGFSRAAMPRQSSLDRYSAAPELAWRPYPAFVHGMPRRLHICYVSQDYPPGVVAGIARVTHELATGLAAAGHVVRVLTRGLSHTVDFEEGVWVHRFPDADAEPPETFTDLPARIWGRSYAVLQELARISAMRPIDLVQAPNWDCEGLATILEGRWPVVLGVYTPMKVALQHNPAWHEDELTLRNVILPIIAGERTCYAQATALIACGAAILRQIEQEYDLTFERRHIGLVRHGLPDLGGTPPPPGDKLTVDILCVGRLEGRKGTDVLLDAFGMLVCQMPEVRLFLAGNDTLPGPGGTTIRQAFSKNPGTEYFRDRVHFLGEVDDAVLDQLYRDADIVAVPSRFESFGLPLIEAMMRSRPVVASNVGGTAEIVEPPIGDDDVTAGTGFLVPPGDAAALAGALRRLAVSALQRRAMGANARAVFVDRYTRDSMAHHAAEFYVRLCDEDSEEMISPAYPEKVA